MPSGGECTCEMPDGTKDPQRCFVHRRSGSIALADDVETLVHAFGDAGRKDAVRELARRVRRLQAERDRLDGQRKVSLRAVRRGLAFLRLNELDDVSDELKSAEVYLRGDPEEDDAGKVWR